MELNRSSSCLKVNGVRKNMNVTSLRPLPWKTIFLKRAELEIKWQSFPLKQIRFIIFLSEPQ